MITPLPETCHGAAVALADIGWWGMTIHYPDPASPSGCSCHDDECSSPAKHPRTRNGLDDATRDFDAIAAMFESGPRSNWAIRTGSCSGIMAVDLDGEEGRDSWRCLTDEFGDPPPTVESLTSNGSHLIFEHVEGVRNSAGKIAPGVDVRGERGYIIVGPSEHISGKRYRWAEGRSPYEIVPAVAPKWLVDLVVPKVPDTFPEPRELPDVYGSRYVAAAIEDECATLATTPEGQRNDQLNRSAYSLARFVQAGDIDLGTVARHLAAAAARAGLGRREIEGTLRSAFRARGAA